MKFLFLFSVLATVLSVSLNKKHSFDAATLLSQTGGKEKILEMIEQLRNDNKETIEKFTKAHDSAVKDDAAKKSAFDAAVHDEEVALGLAADKKATIDTILQPDVDLKRIDEEDAEAKLNLAQNKADAAAKFLAEEEDRINDEKDLLKDVHELLDKLAASASLLEIDDNLASRKLLSIVDLSSLAEADPRAIAEVRQMIDDLIAAGEQDRANAQHADAVAKTELADAKAVHQKYWDILALAIGRVDFATVEFKELTKAATAATQSRKSAQRAHEDAVAALADAKSQLAIETARVEKEEDIFVKVSNLLATIQ